MSQRYILTLVPRDRLRRQIMRCLAIRAIEEFVLFEMAIVTVLHVYEITEIAFNETFLRLLFVMNVDVVFVFFARVERALAKGASEQIVNLFQVFEIFIAVVKFDG